MTRERGADDSQLFWPMNEHSPKITRHLQSDTREARRRSMTGDQSARCSLLKSAGRRGGRARHPPAGSGARRRAKVKKTPLLVRRHRIAVTVSYLFASLNPN